MELWKFQASYIFHYPKHPYERTSGVKQSIPPRHQGRGRQDDRRRQNRGRKDGQTPQLKDHLADNRSPADSPPSKRKGHL